LAHDHYILIFWNDITTKETRERKP
jgi:hypothetical protein